MNFNSEENQRIKGEFVSREVLTCFSEAMSELEEKEVIQFEDWENYFVYPEFHSEFVHFNGGSYDDLQEAIEELQEKIEAREDYLSENGNDEEYPEDEILENMQFDLGELENLEDEPQDIFEYWLVSNWLFEKLRDKGEPVLEWAGLYIWGRTCTGQAIRLDSVISEICSDLGMLVE